jgi:integrase
MRTGSASIMAKSNLRLVPPPTENGTVTQPPRRPPNRELREREHLIAAEVEQLVDAARGNRHGTRDALMILMAYRHGLRAAEVTSLKWEQVDFDRGEIHVNRLKGGTPSTHPLTGRELRELRRHKRDSPASPRFLFVSERGAPMSSEGFNRMVKRAGAAAKLGIKVHAHMLRHACGFKLANDGIDTRSLQAYLGHSNIQNTTRYTALASGRFKEFLAGLSGGRYGTTKWPKSTQNRTA